MRSSLLAAALACLTFTACADEGATGTPPDDAPDGKADDPGDTAPTAAELFALLDSCDVIGGSYATDDGEAETIDICGLTGAVAWTADLDVDCDGQESMLCNIDADPAYQSETAASDSHGDPLDAATLPYVVFPGKSARFYYRDHGLAMGSVVAVLYADRVEYGVAGDVGPSDLIGEASYAMADALGIDPDPSFGGSDGPVGYIAFTGTDARPDVIEDHDEAVRIGVAHARALLATP